MQIKQLIWLVLAFLVFIFFILHVCYSNFLKHHLISWSRNSRMQIRQLIWLLLPFLVFIFFVLHVCYSNFLIHHFISWPRTLHGEMAVQVSPSECLYRIHISVCIQGFSVHWGNSFTVSSLLYKFAQRRKLWNSAKEIVELSEGNCGIMKEWRVCLGPTGSVTLTFVNRPVWT